MCAKSKREIVLYLKSMTKESESGCWEWTGKTHKGYPRVPRSISPSRAGHRAMYEHAVSPITDGLFVLHSCDNPACINPEHLWVGTNRDNMLDKISKGRSSGGAMPNEKNPHCRFTDEQIRAMRDARKVSNCTNKSLAKSFNISESHLSHILNGFVRRSNHLCS